MSTTWKLASRSTLVLAAICAVPALSLWPLLGTAAGGGLSALEIAWVLVATALGAVLLWGLVLRATGRSGGRALSEDERTAAPALIKLLKLTGAINTLGFGSLTWTPNERSTALEAVLDRLALAPNGAQLMINSESGSLASLYRPCFSILASLDTSSPLVDHVEAPRTADAQ